MGLQDLDFEDACTKIEFGGWCVPVITMADNGLIV